MSLRSEPHIELFQAGSVSHIRSTEWESLSHALTSGAEWWEGQTIYGTTVLFRCSTVTDIRFLTAEALAAFDADDAEEQFS